MAATRRDETFVDGIESGQRKGQAGVNQLLERTRVPDDEVVGVRHSTNKGMKKDEIRDAGFDVTQGGNDGLVVVIEYLQ